MAKIGPVFRETHGNGPRSTPTADGERVYALSSRGNLVCASVAEGKLLWQQSMSELDGKMPNWGYTESVLVDGEQVVCTPGGAKGALAALEKKTGKLLWQSQEFTDNAQYASIVPADLNGGRIAGFVEQIGDVLAVVPLRDRAHLGQRITKVGAAGHPSGHAGQPQHRGAVAQHPHRGFLNRLQQPTGVVVDPIGQPAEVVDHADECAAACCQRDRPVVGAQEHGIERVHRLVDVRNQLVHGQSDRRHHARVVVDVLSNRL